MGMFDSFKKSKQSTEENNAIFKKTLEDADRLKGYVKQLEARLSNAMEWKFWITDVPDMQRIKDEDRFLFMFHTGAVLQVQQDKFNRKGFALLSGRPVKGTPIAWVKLTPLDTSV